MRHAGGGDRFNSLATPAQNLLPSDRTLAGADLKTEYLQSVCDVGLTCASKISLDLLCFRQCLRRLARPQYYGHSTPSQWHRLRSRKPGRRASHPQDSCERPPRHQRNPSRDPRRRAVRPSSGAPGQSDGRQPPTFMATVRDPARLVEEADVGKRPSLCCRARRCPSTTPRGTAGARGGPRGAPSGPTPCSANARTSRTELQSEKGGKSKTLRSAVSGLRCPRPQPRIQIPNVRHKVSL